MAVISRWRVWVLNIRSRTFQNIKHFTIYWFVTKSRKAYNYKLVFFYLTKVKASLLTFLYSFDHMCLVCLHNWWRFWLAARYMINCSQPTFWNRVSCERKVESMWKWNGKRKWEQWLYNPQTSLPAKIIRVEWNWIPLGLAPNGFTLFVHWT